MRKGGVAENRRGRAKEKRKRKIGSAAILFLLLPRSSSTLPPPPIPSQLLHFPITSAVPFILPFLPSWSPSPIDSAEENERGNT